jgi:hypothetical protein
MIRFDGLYQAEEGEYYLYVRFFEDGTVITASSDGKPEEVIGWFQKGHPYVSTGAYSLSGDEIAFSAASATGVVDYSGQINGLTLFLRSHSQINGFQTDTEYHFVEVFTALFEGDPVYLQMRCIDVLRFQNDKESDVQEWVFYLKVPSAWAFSPGLQERATRVAVNVYDTLNFQSSVHREVDDGARYVLAGVEAVILSPEAEKRCPWRTQSLYQLLPGEKVKLLI